MSNEIMKKPTLVTFVRDLSYFVQYNAQIISEIENVPDERLKAIINDGRDLPGWQLKIIEEYLLMKERMRAYGSVIEEEKAKPVVKEEPEITWEDLKDEPVELKEKAPEPVPVNVEPVKKTPSDKMKDFVDKENAKVQMEPTKDELREEAKRQAQEQVKNELREEENRLAEERKKQEEEIARIQAEYEERQKKIQRDMEEEFNKAVALKEKEKEELAKKQEQNKAQQDKLAKEIENKEERKEQIKGFMNDGYARRSGINNVADEIVKEAAGAKENAIEKITEEVKEATEVVNEVLEDAEDFPVTDSQEIITVKERDKKDKKPFFSWNK